MADKPNPDGASRSLEFYSAHFESLREAFEALDANDEEAKVEVEIKASKAHWSELTSAFLTAAEDSSAMESSSSCSSEFLSEGMSAEEALRKRHLKVAEDNVHVFQSLQERYPGGFFLAGGDDFLGLEELQQFPAWMCDENGNPLHFELKMSSEKPFAEGAQAQLYHAHARWMDDGSRAEKFVMKVFKKGTSLRDLLRLLPSTLLTDDSMYTYGRFYAGLNSMGIIGARLLKSSGMFGFLLPRGWGDLRKLLDVRMLLFNGQGPLFPDDVTIGIMFHIAKGMQGLHSKDIVHRDLKAANVLVFGMKEKGEWTDVFDPIHLSPFACDVADFECSLGVVGTRFWRAPEILRALKDRSIFQHVELFSKAADVYSFGMTCYEIISGGIPLEELLTSDYDSVINGARPVLPTHTTPWVMDLVTRCWEGNPAMRPTIDEIANTFEQMM